MRYIGTMLVLLFAAVPAFAGTATLNWTDAANNEVGFKIERATGACAPTGLTWAEIGQVGVNANQYVDTTPADGNQYCWRVRAYNYKFTGDTSSIQYSAYSNLAGKEFPLASPAAPSLLGVQ